MFGADDAAAANSVSYGLSLTGPTASGLATAEGDFPITLVATNATTVTGEYFDGVTTQTAFTVVINADGTLTVTQNVALEHLVDGSTPAAHNDTLGLAGLITATVTITDADGDTDSDSAQIGGAVTFFDDGPSAGNDTDNVDALGFTQASGNVITGAGTTSGAWARIWLAPMVARSQASVVSGVPLIVRLMLGSSMWPVSMVRYRSTQTAFTPIPHALSVPSGATETFTYTFKDGDGDTDTATLTINFPTVAQPVVAITGDDCVNEDEVLTTSFTATPGDGISIITEIEITGLTNWCANQGSIAHLRRHARQLVVCRWRTHYWHQRCNGWRRCGGDH